MTLELLYSMRRKPLKCEPPILGNSLDPAVPRPIVKISVENIIAFSSLTELEDSDGDTWGGHVYVCDIDTPWESHKVTSTVHPISAMEWDGEGHQLAVCTRFGEVSVFTQKDNLLNSWTCLYSTNFPGDHILSCIFFHSGRHVILTDKKLDAPITDRIQVARSQPTAKGFGGTPLQGLCVVTATGVTATITMEANNNVAVSPQQRNNITTIVANTHRDTVLAAALAHSNGKILLATLVSSGARASILSHKPHSVTPLTTLMTDTKGCTSITWCQRDDGDYLVIAGPSVTMWKLTEKAHPVHKLLSKGPVQGSTTPGGGPKPIDCFTTLTWTQISWWRVENASLSVAAYNNLNAALAVSCSANAIHVLKEGHALCSKIVNTENEISAPIGTPPKKMKYGHGQITPTPPTLQSVCVSAIGNAVVCVDSRSQLHVLVYLPPPDATLPAIVQQITTSLHYSAVSGYDCLSVLLKLKPAIAEAVYECVTESFQRQSASYQQYYYNNYMKIRIAICKTVGTMTRVYSWLRCSQSVLSCWAQVLTSMASDKYDHEDDKNLWTTEIEWSSTNVQALRPLLSRAVNIAYTVIAALLHHNHTSHEYTLWMDPLSLSTLRKLTAVAACYRGSGRIPEPLPRLLAKLPQAVHSTEFLEECAALSSIPTTHVWESLPRCNVTSPHGTNPPFFLSLSTPPASLKYMSSPPSAAHCDLATITATDAIRYTYLGGGGSSCRHCGRCGARSLANTAFCRCGGHWTLISNV